MADYYYLQEQLPEAEKIVPAIGDRPRQHRQLFLDAGRAVMVYGGALAVLSTLGNPTANATQIAFIGFLAWILGVCLLALLPVAGRFAPAVLAALALASSLLKYFFAPWN